MSADPSAATDAPPAPVATNSASTQRRIAIVVDIFDESDFAVRWAVQYYLRPGDTVVLLLVRPKSVLYGAEWGSIPVSVSGEANAAATGGGASEEELQKKRQEDYDAFTSTKANDLARPLVDAQIPFDIDVVKDHVCFEAERRGLSAMIVGRRSFGPSGKGCKGVLDGVTDYCIKHCVCPIVNVPYPDDDVLEDKPVYHDAPEVQKDVTDTWLTTSTLQPTEEIGSNLIRAAEGYPPTEYHCCFTPSCPLCYHLQSPSQQSPGQTGNPVNYSAQMIGDAFVQQYYHVLREQPDQLHKFYQDSSIIGRPEPNGTMVDVTTLSAINEKIMSMDFRNNIIEIETADAQFSHKAGVLVAVTGSLTSDEVCCRFTQLFFLAPQESGGYFVLNDVFRFISEMKPAEINPVVTLENESSQNIRSPSRTCLTVPEPSNAVRSVISDHVPTDNNITEIQISNPSANGTTIETNANTAPPVQVAKEDPILPPASVPPPPAPTQPDVTKGSYVSIVKGMKEGPPTPPVAKTTLSAGKHGPSPKPVCSEIQISNPSANGTTMKSNANTVPPVQVAKEDPIKATASVPSPTGTTQPDVTKKSYASIVKGMKEGPPTPPVAKTTLSAVKRGPTPKPVSKAVKGLEKSSAKPTQVNETCDAIVAQNNSSRNEQGYSIFFKNMPFSANIEMAEEEFKKFGAIKPGGVQIRHNKVDRFVFGFIAYKSHQSMQAAIEASPICMGGKEVCVEAKRTNSRGGCFQSGRGAYHGNNIRGQGSGYVGNANYRGSDNFDLRNKGENYNCRKESRMHTYRNEGGNNNHGNEGENDTCRNDVDNDSRRNDGDNYSRRNDGENYSRRNVGETIRNDSGENFNRRSNIRNQNEFSGCGRGPPPAGNSYHQNGNGMHAP